MFEDTTCYVCSFIIKCVCTNRTLPDSLLPSALNTLPGKERKKICRKDLVAREKEGKRWTVRRRGFHGSAASMLHITNTSRPNRLTQQNHFCNFSSYFSPVQLGVPLSRPIAQKFVSLASAWGRSGKNRPPARTTRPAGQQEAGRSGGRARRGAAPSQRLYPRVHYQGK